MIAAGPHHSGVQKDAHVQGWLVSVLLHCTMALAAILIVKQIQLAPQEEPFKWNVAIVSPTPPVTPTTSTSPTNQAPLPSVPATTPAPSPLVQEFAPAQTLPSPQPLAQQTTPSISERTVTPVVTEPPAPTPPQPASPSQSAAHTTQAAEPIRPEPVAPMVAKAPSIEKPAEAPTAVSVEPAAAPAAPSIAPSAIPEQTAQSDLAPAPPQMAAISPAPSSVTSAIPEQTAQPDRTPTPPQLAAISPAPSNAPTKRDYGWLSEAILRRVEELKRYPASARVDRAEGKVVVKAVINEDGSIGEVDVFQSSGHPGLDKAAVETMRQAAPFYLPRPLGQARMTIKIPMSYRLDR
ncbi:MAG: TonB family protein [Nitrospirae bacterium]|nr:TonB family protein [Nitrospirota bacterium]